ncbi:Fc.00g092950.m01.CDS01 [Cosmosporella sp. VM-42]
MASMASPEFTKHSTFDRLHHRLDEFWDIVRDLRADSPEDAWDTYASYLNPDCVVYLSGIGAAPSRGSTDAVADMKKLVTYWGLKERRVLSKGVDLEGTTVFACMNNLLVILGEELDFPETEVVEFDNEGRIVDYRLYCDPAPIMAVFQKAQQSG